MKKLLITSTALVLVAGAAVAEVKVGGDARMGIVYNGEDWNFSSRVRVSFTLSGETDGGLQFGASMRVDQEDGWSSTGAASKGGAGNVWISGEWGKISMGDVVGAAEAALFDLPEIGFTDLGGWGGADNDVFYLTGDGALTTNDNPVLLYQYSTGDLNVYLSLSDGKVGQSSVTDDQEYAIGVSYSFGDYSIGLGYEVRDYEAAGWDNDTHIIVGGTATFGTTDVNLFYGSLKVGDVGGAGGHTDSHYGIGVTSQFDALTVSGFVQHWDEDGGSAGDLTTYGIGAAYDLGGGASIVGGIVNDDADGSKAVADIGVKFKF